MKHNADINTCGYNNNLQQLLVNTESVAEILCLPQFAVKQGDIISSMMFSGTVSLMLTVSSHSIVSQPVVILYPLPFEGLHEEC